MSKSPPQQPRITTHTFRLKKQGGERITMLTAYDYLTSRAVDQAGIDSILVGDSLGMVGMDAVKLEGGRERLEAINAIVGSGIPVLGHLGLTPQSVHQLGGFKTQGKTAGAAERLLEDALLLEKAGCFGVVLESVPERVAAYISEKLNIPTIGIGAGIGCDGQVLVTHDLLGLFDKFTPKFVKQYAVLHAEIHQALLAYQTDVIEGEFPGPEHSFTITDEEWELFRKRGGDLVND